MRINAGLFVPFAVVGLVLSLLFSSYGRHVTRVEAATATATPTNDELRDEIDKLKATLAKTRKDRDKYKERLAKSQDKVDALQTEVADLEATVDALREDPTPTRTPKPTQTPKPKPTEAKGATAEELQYWRDVRGIVAQMVEPVVEIDRIVSDPNFDSDPSLWYDMIEAMRPFHGIWAQWQGVTYPTERLKAYHTAVTDALYNYDQAATKFEYGVNNIDSSSILAAADNLNAATEALNRATRELSKWEKATGVKVADI